jgi:hypothetical protein
MDSTGRVKLEIVCVVAAVVLFCPLAASADAGIPMLPIAYPIVLSFLLPVVVIEAVYLQMRLGAGWWRTLKAASIVNAVTLVLGYPLAWVASFLIELILVFLVVLMEKAGLGRLFGDRIYWLSVLSPAWLGSVDSLWPILVAFVVLLVPAFLLSGYVESHMLERYDLLSTLSWQQSSPDEALPPREYLRREETQRKREVWRANLLSYIFLAAVGCLALYLRFRNIHFHPSR